MPSSTSLQLTLALGSDAEGSEPGALLSQPPALFRPIHYLGSKLRLVPAIARALDHADNTRGAVLDLFAGSGTTALALASYRSVIASDIQEYSRVLCSALLAENKPPPSVISAFRRQVVRRALPVVAALRTAIAPLVAFEKDALLAAAHGDPEPICSILESGSILAAERSAGAAPSPAPSPALRCALDEAVERLTSSGLLGSASALTVRYFGGAYFSYEQALELDCLAMVASQFPSEYADVFTAALLSTASDTVNTVGKQFAQPIRPRSKSGAIKRHLLQKIERDRCVDVQATYLAWLARYCEHRRPGAGHIARRADYREALTDFAGQYSVVYADPPYTRDHYSRFYHVLETMSRRDNPAIARNPGADEDELSRGLYREDRHQSPFCIKTQCTGAFDDLFRLASSAGANVVVSYSPFDSESSARPRLMQIEALTELARHYYSRVNLENVRGVLHSKLNHSSLNFEVPDQAEILLICKLIR